MIDVLHSFMLCNVHYCYLVHKDYVCNFITSVLFQVKPTPIPLTATSTSLNPISPTTASTTSSNRIPPTAASTTSAPSVPHQTKKRWRHPVRFVVLYQRPSVKAGSEQQTYE